MGDEAVLTQLRALQEEPLTALVPDDLTKLRRASFSMTQAALAGLVKP